MSQSKFGRRKFLTGVSAAVSGVSIPAFGLENQLKNEGSKASRTQPNIFYICVDDLGSQLNCYGNPEVISPNFDAFAEDSVLFEQAHCQVAVCTASRTSILTGTRPEETGLHTLNHDWKQTLPGVDCLPEHLHKNGYNTVSVGKIWDPRSGPGSNLGWTEKRAEWGVSDNKLAIDMLERYAGQESPLALFLGYRAPHCPWEPGEEPLGLYKDRVITPDGPGRIIETEYLQKCSGANKRDLRLEDALDITRRYYASVTEVDALIGDFLSALKQHGLYDNSVIVLWSGDHGYHLGENDHWGKWTNYSASTRVPLLVRTPGMKTAGRRCSRVVECVDMYPTLVDLADIDKPMNELAGDSFKALLENPQQRWKDAGFSIWFGEADSDGLDKSYAVKTEQYNFIRYESGRVLLFDIIRDPKEIENIATENPAIVARLDAMFAPSWN